MTVASKTAKSSKPEANPVADAARAVVAVNEQIAALEAKLLELEAAREIVAQAAAAQALGEELPAGATEARALLAQEAELRATQHGLTRALAERAEVYRTLLAERSRVRRDQLARELHERTTELDRRAVQFHKEAQREQVAINDLRTRLVVAGADATRAEKMQVAELVTRAEQATKEAQ